ncbi:transketolase [Alphaproteobacteria bacterium]|nr:transketolase [Alphaproteobacteria bacterium]
MLDKKSIELRVIILEMIKSHGRGHVGSAMSLVELIRVLYEISNISKANLKNPKRDRIILSKGHGCLAQYATLLDIGIISKKEIKLFCNPDGILGGHPERGKVPGIEASTGSLGHGFSIGVGMALASKKLHNDNNIFVIVGDGELNEGSNWEAALSASKNELDNLSLIVDYNKMQSYGALEEVVNSYPLLDKFKSFGFDVSEFDGHSILDIKKTISKRKKNKKPKLFLSHSIKGKGIKDAENNSEWHHKSNLNKEIIDKLKKEIQENLN